MFEAIVAIIGCKALFKYGHVEIQIDLFSQLGNVSLTDITPDAVGIDDIPQTVLIIGRIENDRNMAGIAVEVEQLGQPVAGEGRYVDIKQNEIGLKLTHEIGHPEAAGMGNDLYSFILEQFLGRVQMHFVVINHQYLFFIPHYHNLLSLLFCSIKNKISRVLKTQQQRLLFLPEFRRRCTEILVYLFTKVSGVSFADITPYITG
jgi:hypothetical protein